MAYYMQDDHSDSEHSDSECSDSEQSDSEQSDSEKVVEAQQVRQIVVPQRFGGKTAYYVKDDDNDSEQSDSEQGVEDTDSEQEVEAQQVIVPQRFGVKMACYEQDKRNKDTNQRCFELAETICTSVKGQRELNVEYKAVFDRLASFRKQARAAKKALKKMMIESNLETFRTSAGDFNCEIVQKKNEQPRIVIKIKPAKPAKGTKSAKLEKPTKRTKSAKRLKLDDVDSNVK